MEAKELRIGNLLNHNNKFFIGPFTVNSIHISDLERDNAYAKEYEPIPLTEEWLIEFGFEERLGGRFFKHTWFYIDQDCAGVSGWYFRSIDGFKAKCEYIHQLQNLYFALTNKELTINK